MEYSVTCDGVPVGTTAIEPLSGLAHGVLRPLAAFGSIREHAIDAAYRLQTLRILNTLEGDFAEQFARDWGGGRLALVDSLGVEVGVASIVIIGTARPVVVVDARPDMARVEAFLRTIGGDSTGRKGPAA